MPARLAFSAEAQVSPHDEFWLLTGLGGWVFIAGLISSIRHSAWLHFELKLTLGHLLSMHSLLGTCLPAGPYRSGQNRGRGRMDNAAKDAETIRAVRDRLRNEVAELDRLGQNLAANALSHTIDLLNDDRGKLENIHSNAGQRSCPSD